MAVNPWNTCFLCRSHEVDVNVNKFNSTDDTKTVKPSFELLIKYLINSYNTEPNHEISNVPQLISKVIINQSPAWKVKLCCRCDEVADVVLKLKLKIETLQRNIKNLLKTVGKRVILGSESDEFEDKDDVASHEFFQVLRNFQRHIINGNTDKEISGLNAFSLSLDNKTADCKQSVSNVEIIVEPYDESNEDFQDSEPTPYETTQTEDKPEYTPASIQQDVSQPSQHMTTNITQLPVLKNRKRTSTRQQQARKSKRKVANILSDDDNYEPLPKMSDQDKSTNKKDLPVLRDFTSFTDLTFSTSTLKKVFSAPQKQKGKVNCKTTLQKSKSNAKPKSSKIKPLILNDDIESSEEEYTESKKLKEDKDRDYTPDKKEIKKFKETITDWELNLTQNIEKTYRSTRATRSSSSLPPPDELITSNVKPSKRSSPPKRSCKQVKTPVRDLTPAQKLAQEHRKYIKYAMPVQRTCRQCQGKFKCYSFEHHLRSHETQEKKYTCPDCQIGFTTRQLFNIHLAAHFGQKYACDICKEYYYRLDLNKHLLETHPGNFHQCNFCSSVFGKFSSLVIHMKHHPRLGLSCDLCLPKNDAISKVYGRLHLLQHLHEIHNLTDFILTCDKPDCSEVFYDQFAKIGHMNKHLEKYKCEFCFKCYTNQSRLDEHVRIHTGETPIECDECLEKFKNKERLRLHKMDIHGLTKYKCEHCGKEYRFQQQMSRHVKIVHKVINPTKGFNCSECDKWCLSKFDLKKHMGSHQEKTRDFACEICGHLSTSIVALNKHKISHSDVKKHACSYCPKRFTQLHYLKDHLRTHTKEKPFQCEHCGNAYNQAGALHMHKKAKHPEIFKNKLPSETATSNVTVTSQVSRTTSKGQGQLSLFL